MAWNGADSVGTASGGGRGQAATGNSARKQSKNQTLLRGALAGLLVIVLGGAALWLFVGGRDKRVPPQITQAKQQTGKPLNNAPRKSSTTNKIARASAKEKLPMPKLSGVRIDKREEVVAPQPLEEMQQAMTNKVAKKKKVAFRNGMEQLIALATPSSPGAPVPPLPPITEESVADEVKKGMDHVIKAEEDDSPELLEKKLTVAEAKEEFRQLREQEGWGFAEYVNALRDKANADSEFLCEAHKMCDELYHDKSVSDTDYIKYRDQINEKLRERGLPEIEKEEEEGETK